MFYRTLIDRHLYYVLTGICDRGRDVAPGEFEDIADPCVDLVEALWLPSWWSAETTFACLPGAWQEEVARHIAEDRLEYGDGAREDIRKELQPCTVLVANPELYVIVPEEWYDCSMAHGPLSSNRHGPWAHPHAVVEDGFEEAVRVAKEKAKDSAGPGGRTWWAVFRFGNLKHPLAHGWVTQDFGGGESTAKYGEGEEC